MISAIAGYAYQQERQTWWKWNIALPKWFCKLRSQTKSFFVINVNAILTLQLRPQAGHFDQHGAWAAELKWRWRILQKNFWSESLAYKSTLEKQYFIVSEPKGEVLALKLTNWQPFILQNANGRSGLNLWATPFKFWKSTNLVKLFKWF